VIVNDKLYYTCKKADSEGKEPFTALPQAPKAPLQQFADAVAGNRPQPLVTPREAAARVDVMEAMYLGARSSKWVKMG
jgi:predicted dehydrogenase